MKQDSAEEICNFQSMNQHIKDNTKITVNKSNLLSQTAFRGDIFLNASEYTYMCSKIFLQMKDIDISANKSLEQCIICGLYFNFKYSLGKHFTSQNENLILKLVGISEEMSFPNHCSLNLYLKKYTNCLKNKNITSLIQYVRIKKCNLQNCYDFNESNEQFFYKLLNINKQDNHTLNSKLTDHLISKFNDNAINLNQPELEKQNKKQKKINNKTPTSGKILSFKNTCNPHFTKSPFPLSITDNIIETTSFLNDKTNNYICNECLMPTSSFKTLKIHHDLHNKFNFGCLCCCQYFGKKSELNLHILKSLILKDKTKTRNCWAAFCKRLFFKCPICDKGSENGLGILFKTSSFKALKFHLLKNHNFQCNEDLIICWYCLERCHVMTEKHDEGKGISRHSSLVWHILSCKSAVNHKEYLYVCPFCKSNRSLKRSNKFKTVLEIIIHVKKTHQSLLANSKDDPTILTKFLPRPSSFKCPVCKLFFDDRRLLENHSFIRGHDIRPVKTLNKSTSSIDEIDNLSSPSVHLEHQFSTSNILDENLQSIDCALRPSISYETSATNLSSDESTNYKQSIRNPNNFSPFKIQLVNGLDKILEKLKESSVKISSCRVEDANNNTFVDNHSTSISSPLPVLESPYYTPDYHADCIQNVPISLVMCKICNLKFLRPLNLMLHGEKHLPEYPYLCPLCNNMNFGNDVNLKGHIKEDHGNILKCIHCEDNFHNPPSLIKHLRDVTGAENLICPFCGLCFMKMEKYEYHLNLYHGQKRWSCYLCWICKERCFKKSGKFVEHLTTTHGLSDPETDIEKLSTKKVTSYTSGLDGGPKIISTILSPQYETKGNREIPISKLPSDIADLSLDFYLQREDEEGITLPTHLALLKNCDNKNTASPIIKPSRRSKRSRKAAPCSENVDEEILNGSTLNNTDLLESGDETLTELPISLSLSSNNDCQILLENLSEKYLLNPNLPVSSDAIMHLLKDSCRLPTTSTTTPMKDQSLSFLDDNSSDRCQNILTFYSNVSPDTANIHSSFHKNICENTLNNSGKRTLSVSLPLRGAKKYLLFKGNLGTIIQSTTVNTDRPYNARAAEIIFTPNLAKQPIFYKCSVCSVEFRDQASLLKHGRNHGSAFLTIYTPNSSHRNLPSSNTKEIHKKLYNI